MTLRVVTWCEFTAWTDSDSNPASFCFHPLKSNRQQRSDRKQKMGWHSCPVGDGHESRTLQFMVGSLTSAPSGRSNSSICLWFRTLKLSVLLMCVPVNHDNTILHLFLYMIISLTKRKRSIQDLWTIFGPLCYHKMSSFRFVETKTQKLTFRWLFYDTLSMRVCGFSIFSHFMNILFLKTWRINVWWLLKVFSDLWRKRKNIWLSYFNKINPVLELHAN